MTALFRDAVLRTDFYAFVQRVFAELRPGDHFLPNWHIDAVCKAVMDVVDGRDLRLLVTLPPRSLKSLIISVALPAYVLGRDPTRRIICSPRRRTTATRRPSPALPAMRK